ncbi:OLC1v1013830C1 [Oldenlandia corymbosa var. corymbosa]|uniref:CASP-like protein n=1 Tax=Oldenlandia corymbosa var. corymbosa TaxID=529605 RepID=A0AAV1E1R6_OLDCO|nr:OLC1v1013830C1 [Oldenlandia corymbosa var. corymbosa]
MASKKVVNSVLALRVVTLLLLAASVVVMVLNKVKFSDGSKFSFSDLHAYRYEVAVVGVGFVYTLIQLPFAIFHAATGKRWIKGSFLPELDFYGDKVVSWILATGVGVGFGITFEVKRFLDQFFTAFEQVGGAADGGNQELKETESKTSKFFDRADIATGILLVGFAIMAITSVLTSLKKRSKY